MTADRSNAILITRPEPGASETAHRIAALGLTPLLCPVLQIRTLAVTLPPALQVAALLVTSGNAIPALPAAYHPLPLFAVGNATAERARAAGFTQVTSADGDARALVERARRLLDPSLGALLLVTGKHNGGPLAAELRQSGFRVRRRVVYAAAPSDELPPAAIGALQASQVQAALFFSAETVRHFLRLARRADVTASLRVVDAVAIGRAAGMALEAVPWRCVRVAARPNQDEMLALL